MGRNTNRSRLVGYLGSRDAWTRDKIVWNISDWRERLRGRFRNELGAHAGFTRGELHALLGDRFRLVVDETCAYYALLYPRHRRAFSILERLRLAKFVFPAVYFSGARVSARAGQVYGPWHRGRSARPFGSDDLLERAQVLARDVPASNSRTFSRFASPSRRARSVSERIRTRQSASPSTSPAATKSALISSSRWSAAPLERRRHDGQPCRHRLEDHGRESPRRASSAVRTHRQPRTSQPARHLRRSPASSPSPRLRAPYASARSDRLLRALLLRSRDGRGRLLNEREAPGRASETPLLGMRRATQRIVFRLVAEALNVALRREAAEVGCARPRRASLGLNAVHSRALLLREHEHTRGARAGAPRSQA